jgi:hypothetical protein
VAQAESMAIERSSRLLALLSCGIEQLPHSNPNMKILHVVDEIKPFFFIHSSAYNRYIEFRHPDFLMDI